MPTPQASLPSTLPDDAHWMRLALAEARAAADAGEVPVGAVVVHQGRLLATGRNNPVSAHDPCGHAEVNALRAAAAARGNYRLEGCELFVTLEPCPMCAGAMLHARLARVVFGAADPRTGAAGSVVDLFAQPALNHHTRVQGGLLAEACARPLQDFFQARRAQARAAAQPLRDDALRTPESRFAAFAPPVPLRWVHDLPALQGLRMAWLDNQDALLAQAEAAPPVLCLHGPGQWSELYRELWPLIGPRRLLVPDLIGHGRSDKPKRAEVHSTDWHAQVLDEWLAALALAPVTLVFHPGMAAVAQALARRPRRVAQQLALPATALEPAGQAPWLAAPFPDRGHAAALRAWHLAHPSDEQLPAAGVITVAQALHPAPPAEV